MTQVLVLCYHAISDAWHAPLSVTPRALRRQLEGLVNRGWRGVTFTEAVLAPPAPKTLAVTFDDAFASVRTKGAPLLAELGLAGTVFAVTAWAGRRMRWSGIDHWWGGPFESELDAMSWDDLRSLAASGWEIGAHTCSHPRLTRLPRADLERELVESRAACEREIGPCRSFAYPFGDADARVRAAVQAAGYEVAAGLSSAAFADPSHLEWPRIGVWHDDPYWRFRLKAVPSVLRIHGRLRQLAPRRN